MRLRFIARVTVRLTLLFLLASLVPAAGAVPDVVRVTFQPFQSNGALFIADREGYFGAEGIQIRWVPLTSVEMIPVLTQGQLDVGAGALSAAFFNVVAAGQKVRLVADKGHASGRGTVGSLVIRKSLAETVRSIEHLRNRKVAVSGAGSLSHYVLARALAGAGLPLDAVTVLFMPLPDAVAALQGGSIDAALLPVPLDTQAVEAGTAVKFLDMAELVPGEPTAFLIYGPTFLEQHRNLGTRFTVAYLRGVRRYNEGPTPRNVTTVAEYTKIDVAVLRKSDWIGIHLDGFIEMGKLRRYQDWLYEIGLIGVRSPMSAVVDPSFAEAARTTLGLPGR